ncbi:MAG: hypothetical protein JNK53_00895, partial [Phycisphaerae bacterium]|nr:hypothetical protein [Phycisphaerae bacterium]
MATKISKPRVSELSKELGVSWKDIAARCTAEGVEVPKSAASSVSVGLAETIREWFQNAAPAPAPTLEPKKSITAPAKKATRRTGRTGKAAGVAEEAAAPEAVSDAGSPASVAEAPAAKPAKSTAPVAAVAPAAAAEIKSEPVAAPAAIASAAPAASSVAPTVAAPTDDSGGEAEGNSATRLPTEGAEVVMSADSASMQTAIDAPSSPTIIGKAHRAPVRPIETPAPTNSPAARAGGAAARQQPVQHTIAPASAPPVMNVPKRPDVVKPVGQMLERPVKTAMSGPQVIRVDAPDNLPAPRRAATTGNFGARPGPGGAGVRTGDRPTRSNRTASA